MRKGGAGVRFCKMVFAFSFSRSKGALEVRGDISIEVATLSCVIQAFVDTAQGLGKLLGLVLSFAISFSIPG